MGKNELNKICDFFIVGIVSSFSARSIKCPSSARLGTFIAWLSLSRKIPARTHLYHWPIALWPFQNVIYGCPKRKRQTRLPFYISLSTMVSKVTVELTCFFDFFCYIISINEEVHDRKRKDAEYQCRMLIEPRALSSWLSLWLATRPNRPILICAVLALHLLFYFSMVSINSFWKYLGI